MFASASDLVDYRLLIRFTRWFLKASVCHAVAHVCKWTNGARDLVVYRLLIRFAMRFLKASVRFLMFATSGLTVLVISSCIDIS